jgi:hypothetical protein
MAFLSAFGIVLVPSTARCDVMWCGVVSLGSNDLGCDMALVRRSSHRVVVSTTETASQVEVVVSMKSMKWNRVQRGEM